MTALSIEETDGATNSTTSVPSGSYPEAVAVNPISNEIYVADNGGNTITVIEEQQVQPIPLIFVWKPSI